MIISSVRVIIQSQSNFLKIAIWIKYYIYYSLFLSWWYTCRCLFQVICSNKFDIVLSAFRLYLMTLCVTSGKRRVNVFSILLQLQLMKPKELFILSKYNLYFFKKKIKCFFSFGIFFRGFAYSILKLLIIVNYIIWVIFYYFKLMSAEFF